MIDTEQDPETRFGDNSFLSMPPGHHPSTLAEPLDFWCWRKDCFCVTSELSSRPVFLNCLTDFSDQRGWFLMKTSVSIR